MPDDAAWMRRALALAGEGVAFASPNPTVGCVLVRDGVVVGEGFHDYAQRDHAEVVALRQAGDAARGATAYVTLEPCSHHGRTPPCADALIAAGLARVVVATRDPNPQVRGQGIAKLVNAGIAVTEDVMQRDARTRNNAFAKWITTGSPFVTLKAAVSADGKIAPMPGSLPRGLRLRLTGAAANTRVQQMRAENDALLTGVGTVLADDPLLTDRSGHARRRPLLRCVVDSRLRTPLGSRLMQSAREDVVIFCADAEGESARELRGRGVEVVALPADDADHISLEAVLRELAARQMTSVLLEAGARLNTAMVQAQLVDAMAVFHTPRSLGEDAVPLFTGPLPEAAAESDISQLDNDRLEFTLLRDPWTQPDVPLG